MVLLIDPFLRSGFLAHGGGADSGTTAIGIGGWYSTVKKQTALWLASTMLDHNTSLRVSVEATIIMILVK